MARRDTFTAAELVAISIGLRMLASRQDGTAHAETARQLLAAEFGDAADAATDVERDSGPRIKAYLINAGTPDERISRTPPEGDAGIRVQPLGVISWLSPEALQKLKLAQAGRAGLAAATTCGPQAAVCGAPADTCGAAPHIAGAEAAAGAPATVPAGWALVPVEPTDEMLQAAHDGDREYTLRNFGDIMTVMQGPYDHWCAMLAAAPKAAKEGGAA